MSLQVEIRKVFSDFTLEVAFETQAGMLGLLGASGSGKSMTLRCIAGIVRPDSGKILLNGRTLFDSAARIDLPPQQRRVGLLFQNYALFPKMTAAQNVAAGIKRRDEREERVSRLLTLMRLEELAERYPYQLSGGQQQRVALARMLASEPELLLFDEPFSALDGQLRHTIEPEFRQALAAASCPSVYVSHSVSEIYRFCDRTAALVAGRVVECNATKELFSMPEQLETARLLCVRNLAPLANPDGEWADVPDWGVRLRFPKATAGYAYAGVHADDLTLCEQAGENRVPVVIEAVEERPRFLAVTVRAAGAAKPLRVNCPRELAARIAAGDPPQYLAFHGQCPLRADG